MDVPLFMPTVFGDILTALGILMAAKGRQHKTAAFSDHVIVIGATGAGILKILDSSTSA
jgi:hypothetical protein